MKLRGLSVTRARAVNEAAKALHMAIEQEYERAPAAVRWQHRQDWQRALNIEGVTKSVPPPARI